MPEQRWDELKQLLTQAFSRRLGRVEYGNLRLEVYDGDANASDHPRIAIAYEVPGGSTNQFALSYEDGVFHTLDSTADGVLELVEPKAVVQHLSALVDAIPQYRADRLHADIDSLIAKGASRRDVLEELSRLLRLGTEFRGGSLTVPELTSACLYVADRYEPAGA